jgi:hypothetical protein
MVKSEKMEEENGILWEKMGNGRVGKKTDWSSFPVGVYNFGIFGGTPVGLEK